MPFFTSHFHPGESVINSFNHYKNCVEKAVEIYVKIKIKKNEMLEPWKKKKELGIRI